MLFPTESTDRLLANLKSGQPSLCAYVFSHPNMVEVAGIAGIDCFMADMMFTAHDWDNIAHLVRAARGTGISPMIRVQAFPWATGSDRRTVSDAARALALGATAVTVSVGSKEEVRELVGLRDDWHRLIHLRRFSTAEDFPEYNDRTREGTLVVPTVESEGGLRDRRRPPGMAGRRRHHQDPGRPIQVRRPQGHAAVGGRGQDRGALRRVYHVQHGSGLAGLRRNGGVGPTLLRGGREGRGAGRHGMAHADGIAAHQEAGHRVNRKLRMKNKPEPNFAFEILDFKFT